MMPPGRRRRWWPGPWLWHAVLALAVVAVYSPACLGPTGWVWDDISVVENAAVHAPDGLHTLWLDPRLNMGEEHYWPLTYTSFYIERATIGLAPGSARFINALLHAAAACLLASTAHRLGLWRGVAFFAAGLWALHPQRAESVAWVIERKDVLSLVLALASMRVLAGRAWVRAGWAREAAAAALFAAALLAKTSVAPLPLAAALVFRDNRHRLFLLGLAAVALAFALLDTQFVRSITPLDVQFSLLERLGIGARAAWWYGAKFFVPPPQMAIYPRWSVAPSTLAVGAVVAAFALFGWAAAQAVRASRGSAPWNSTRALAATVLGATMLAAPTLGFVPFGFQRYSFVADRYSYLPSIALAFGATSIGWLAIERRRRARSARAVSKTAVAVAALSVLFFISALTIRRAPLYGNAAALWAENIARNPAAWEAWNQLARLDTQAGRYADALEKYRKTLALRPDYYQAHSNLGATLMRAGDLPGAEAPLRRALELNPTYAEGWNNFGVWLGRQGRRPEAAEAFKNALSANPFFEDAKRNLRIATGGQS